MSDEAKRKAVARVLGCAWTQVVRSGRAYHGLYDRRTFLCLTQSERDEMQGCVQYIRPRYSTDEVQFRLHEAQVDFVDGFYVVEVPQ
jgi:hypothetical protein